MCYVKYRGVSILCDIETLTKVSTYFASVFESGCKNIDLPDNFLDGNVTVEQLKDFLHKLHLLANKVHCMLLPGMLMYYKKQLTHVVSMADNMVILSDTLLPVPIDSPDLELFGTQQLKHWRENHIEIGSIVSIKSRWLFAYRHEPSDVTNIRNGTIEINRIFETEREYLYPVQKNIQVEPGHFDVMLSLSSYFGSTVVTDEICDLLLPILEHNRAFDSIFQLLKSVDKYGPVSLIQKTADALRTEVYFKDKSARLQCLSKNTLWYLYQKELSGSCFMEIK